MQDLQARGIAFWFFFSGMIALLLPPFGNASPPPTSMNAEASKSSLSATLLKAPLSFEANQGQTDPSVNFIARGSSYTLFLTPTESVMVLQQREAKAQEADQVHNDPLVMTELTSIKQSVVRMKLEGANPSPLVEGQEKLPGIVNYFIGNDPEKWRTKIPTYAKVHYKEAYPGIDVAYYGSSQGRLEYDFIVAPGADPNQIKLAFEGASNIKVADSGDLILTTALGEVRMQKPIVYQIEQDGHKTLVAGNYIASPGGANGVGIQLAAYDQSRPVVIDPVLLYSTYLGGSANEAGIEFGPHGIAVNFSGEAYVAGATASVNFPGVSSGSIQPMNGGGAFDAYVVKLNSTGSSFLWASYLGGTGYDRAAAIALDTLGNAYVTGLTASTTVTSATFPTTAGAFQTTGAPNKVFVSKVSSDGSTLLYSTLLGGASDRDIGWGIAVDSSGNAYVTGEARNTFPVTPGAFQTVPADATGNADVFVTKLNPGGTGLIYSTLVGGSLSEAGFGIAIDVAGNAYVTGLTNSPNFPGTTSSTIQPTFMGGTNDGFVFKLNPTGTALTWSTYLGGTADDIGRAIAVDTSGNAYATGQTASTNFPITVGSFQSTLGNASGQYDAYVTKINGTGNLVYSTYLGGSSYDGGWAIKADGAGNAYISGRGRSINFPGIVPLTGSPVPSPAQWAFFSKLNSLGSALEFSVYIGGTIAVPSTSGDTEPLGLALDANANAYITGFTRSANFPFLNGVQATPGGLIDDFVMKINTKPIANAGPDQSVPEGTMVTLDGTGSTAGIPNYIWQQVGGPPVFLANSGSAHPTFTAPHVPPAGATLTFELIVCEGTSPTNCSDPDSVNVHVTNINQPPVSDAGPDQTVQEGSPVVLDGSGSYDPDVHLVTYHWLQLFGPPVVLANATTATPSFTAPSVGTGGGQVDFELIVTDPHGLNHSDYVSVFLTNVNQVPVANAGPDQTVNENSPVTLNGSGSHDPDLDLLSYAWSQISGPFVTLTGGTTASPTFTAPAVGAGGMMFTFRLVASDGHASSAADTVNILVQDTNDPPLCTLAQASPNLLWPPNHTMVAVGIIGITDPNDQNITITFPAVTQDEPVNGLGDGDTSPDAAVSGNQILLRAERDGTGNGRVYQVHFTATDEHGATCNGTVKVGVPHSKKDTAVEGPQLYNSFAP